MQNAPNHRTMKEAYCSYEISKLLKEKGFDEPTTHWYNVKKSLINDYPVSYENFGNPENVWLAPTHQMACAWLRKKGYHVAVLYSTKFKSWERIIQASTGVKWSLGGFGSHDEAVEDGIKYALEILI